LSTISKSGVSVDCVVLRYNAELANLEVLLVDRKEKIAGQPTVSLPGDSVRSSEEVMAAAKRVLFNQAGLNTPLYRFRSFEDPSRLNEQDQPEKRVITKAYLGFTTSNTVKFGDLAANGFFVSIDEVPEKMLYDHTSIFRSGLDALTKAAENHLVPLDGMPSSFTTTQLQNFYEVILGKSLDKRNFRRSILNRDYLEETGEFLRGTNFRPAKLFKFNQMKFQRCLDKELEKLPVILF
jgi:8-oxo-dGTP diphosphatase